MHNFLSLDRDGRLREHQALQEVDGKCALRMRPALLPRHRRAAGRAQAEEGQKVRVATRQELPEIPNLRYMILFRGSGSRPAAVSALDQQTFEQSSVSLEPLQPLHADRTVGEDMFFTCFSHPPFGHRYWPYPTFR